MDSTTPSGGQQGETATQWWRIGRASLRFILDTIALSRGQRDILDPLILSVVVESNVAAISQDPDLQRRYATAEEAPPDELRRPVSVSAVAASLRLPYETVRRRIVKLAEIGGCEITPRGVLVPTAILNSPFYLLTAAARFERLKRFYFEVQALGALPNLPPPQNDLRSFDAPPMRIANRIISEYMLRVIDQLMRRLGDPLSGLILLEMTRANAEHLSREVLDMDGPVPDSLRQPIRTLTLAKRLGLPAETVRRHVARLEAEEFCRKVAGGRLAATDGFGRFADGGNGLIDNLVNVHRLFGRLAALGVTAYWDAEGERAQASAGAQ